MLKCKACKKFSCKCTDIKEDGVAAGAPINSVGSYGSNTNAPIAGIGVGKNGEPGVSRKAMGKYQKKNAKEAPSPILSSMNRRKTFTEFLNGKN